MWPVSSRRSIRVLAALAAAVLSACATVDPKETQPQAETGFEGTLAVGELRGERSAAVQAAIEAAALQTFPKGRWLHGPNAKPDILIDIVVHSARVTDARSSQEARNCRRYSEPDKDARGLQRLLSVKCLDWDVRQVPCLTRTYDIDLQFRARSEQGTRLIASDRKVSSSSDRQCGSEAMASTAQLQAQAEQRAARWSMDQLRTPAVQWTRSIQAAAAASIPAPLPAQTPAAVPAAPPLGQTAAIPSPDRVTPNPPPSTPVAAPTDRADAIAAGQAHALVIGNAAYPGSARLANPVNDARGIARKFSDMGFAVTLLENVDRAALTRELDRFQARSSQSALTVLYYSGHGMQIDGVNYLLPVDVNLAQPSTLRLQGVSVNSVIDAYLPGRARVVFLDACRDNPAITAQTRGARRGLAPIDAPQGTLIAYATRDGGVAEDGTGQHSPFTQALLEFISEPEDISLVLRKVRDRVMTTTAGRQQPWEYGSLSGGSLVFSRMKPAAPRPATVR